VCAALGLRAGPASALRWDGRSWWFSSGNERALAGDVGVAIDLGAWMLLRFVPQVRRGRWRTRWVSLQRRGLEGEWHALRCIVHAARTNEASVA
jgi:hypothetical protein